MDERASHELAIATVETAIVQVTELSRCECCDRALVKLKEALFWLREQTASEQSESVSDSLAQGASAPAIRIISQAIASDYEDEKSEVL